MKSGIKRKQLSKPFSQNKRAKISKKQKEDEEEKKYEDDDDDELMEGDEEDQEFEVGPEALRKNANNPDLDLSDDDKDNEIVTKNQEDEDESDEEETIEQAKLKMVKKFLDKTRNFLKEKEEIDDEGKIDDVQRISEYLEAEKKKQKQKLTHQGLSARIKKMPYKENENFHIFKGNSPQANDSGHKNTVTSVAISPKQPNLVFTAALDCCIIEWDLLTGKKIIISKGKKIKSSANKEKKEKKGKTKAKKPQKQKKPQKNEVILPKTDDHTDAILCLDVSNDGRFLASAGKDKVIKIWDIATKKFLFQFDHAHSSVITSVSFNKLKVGKTSSSSSTNDQDDDDEKVGGKNEFTVDFQKETNALASSSTDLTLKMWDVDDQMFYQTLHGHEGALLGVDCITRNIVVTSSIDTTVRVWKVEEETQLIFGGKKLALADAADQNEKATKAMADDLSAQLKAKLNEAKPSLFSDMPQSFSGDDHQKNVLLSSKGAKRSGHIYPVNCAKFLGSPKWFVSGSQDGSIMIWNYEKKRCVAVYEEAHGGAWITAIGVPKFAFGSSLDQKLYANEQVFATGSSDGYLKFWKFDTNAKFGTARQTIQFLNQVKMPGHVNSIDFGSFDESTIKNLNVEDQKMVKKLDFVVCGVGRTHSLGRWGEKPNKEMKNGIYVVKIDSF